MNQPYVKQFDANGTLLNPIKGTYSSEFPNRRKRREFKNQLPFHGCGKNYPLTCDGKYTWKRVRQFEKDKEGDRKVIYHYLLS